MSNPWLPLQYGYSVAYALFIEGVPLFIEGIPSAWSEVRGLFIDKSGEVGQQIDLANGIGAGMPLTFQLNSTDFDAYCQRWSLEAFATGPNAWDSGTINVEDTTGWPSPSGTFWVGNERVTYTGTTPTSFTGCTRGTAQSKPVDIYKGIVANMLTDKPRIWRGREVRLCAVLVDPGGGGFSTPWEVWRGSIDQGPTRDGAVWSFDCLPLERRLTMPVSGALSGIVSKQPPRYTVAAGVQKIQFAITGRDQAGAHTFEMNFFVSAGGASAVKQTIAEQIAGLQASWETARTLIDPITSMAYSTWLGSLEITDIDNDPFLRWSFPYTSDGTTTYVTTHAVCVNGSEQFSGINPPDSGVVTGDLRLLSRRGSIVPFTYPTWWYQNIPAAPQAFVIEPATLASAVIPTYGVLKIGDEEFTYIGAEAIGDYVYIANVTGPGFKTGTPAQPASAYWGMEAQFLNILSSLASTSMATALASLLQSSGTGDMGTYDTLPSGFGYGIRGVNSDSFVTVGAAMNALSIYARFEAGASLESVFGGMLSLHQLAITTRLIDDTVELCLVRTAPAGSDYKSTITDADVIIGDGPAFTTIAGQEQINTVLVEFADGVDPPNKVPVQDTQNAVIAGVVSQDCSIPATFGIASVDYVTDLARARMIASQTLQTIEVRLMPWATAHNVDVGDLVYLNTTHFGIWTWATGTQGYAGVARVVGLRRRLYDGAMTLTLLIDGAVLGAGLCPSMAITATDNVTDPTYIRCSLSALDHFQTALELEGGPIALIIYKPGLGDESTYFIITVDAATEVSGTCNLSVSYYDAGLNIVTGTDHVTIGPTVECTTYQSGFAHTDAGQKWG